MQFLILNYSMATDKLKEIVLFKANFKYTEDYRNVMTNVIW